MSMFTKQGLANSKKLLMKRIKKDAVEKTPDQKTI